MYMVQLEGLSSSSRISVIFLFIPRAATKFSETHGPEQRIMNWIMSHCQAHPPTMNHAVEVYRTSHGDMRLHHDRAQDRTRALLPNP